LHLVAAVASRDVPGRPSLTDVEIDCKLVLAGGCVKGAHDSSITDQLDPAEAIGPCTNSALLRGGRQRHHRSASAATDLENQQRATGDEAAAGRDCGGDARHFDTAIEMRIHTHLARNAAAGPVEGSIGRPGSGDVVSVIE